MPNLFAIAVLALAANGAPDFPPEEAATLYDGTVVVKPAGWLPLSEKQPAYYRQWAAQTNKGPDLMLEVFVAPGLIGEWDKIGGPIPILGRNLLAVQRCNVPFAGSPEWRRKTLDALAGGMLTAMRDKRREANEADRKPLELPFGPSVRDDRLIMVMRKEYDWPEQRGNYLMATAIFPLGDDCRMLMLNGKEGESDDVSDLVARVEHYADATSKAQPPEPDSPRLSGTNVALADDLPFFVPEGMVALRRKAPGLWAQMLSTEDGDDTLIEAFTTPGSLAAFRENGAPAGVGTHLLKVSRCKVERPADPVERAKQLIERERNERDAVIDSRIENAGGTGSGVEAALGPTVRHGRIVTVGRVPLLPGEAQPVVMFGHMVFWPGNRCMALKYKRYETEPDTVNTLVRTLEGIAAGTEALAAAQTPPKAKRP